MIVSKLDRFKNFAVCRGSFNAGDVLEHPSEGYWIHSHVLAIAGEGTATIGSTTIPVPNDQPVDVSEYQGQVISYSTDQLSCTWIALIPRFGASALNVQKVHLTEGATETIEAPADCSIYPYSGALSLDGSPMKNFQPVTTTTAKTLTLTAQSEGCALIITPV